MAPESFSIVIPAFNEAERLPLHLEQIERYFRDAGTEYEIIVVDDGSTDATAAVLSEPARCSTRLRLIRLPENRGKGHAVKTGMLAARGTFRIFTDADGSTPIEELQRLKARLTGGVEIAIGSRALRDPSRMVRGTLHRKVMGTVFNWIARSVTSAGVADTQCGFKLFTERAVAAIFPLQRIDGFGFDVELLFLARKYGFPIAEVPVNWTNVAGSKVRLIRDSWRMFLDVMRVRGNDLLGRYRLGKQGR
ncbi:dolichyl-phosphate beta-glucosyltransferase [Geomesophilobacter sediminis]|uniref:dolichyl-phosphate beta-glucosyltransferase n=1 Tax=Geomesophilobacter sediminis TaxID=2798584 RepID=UPI002E29D8E8|nr:dolichyl-phosphate beta-glucosyltransferase [Geomesophilobacter sediminis]